MASDLRHRGPRAPAVEASGRRATLRSILATVLGGWATSPAWGVMAGSPAGEADDSPQRRVDPNTAHSPWRGVAALVTSRGVFGSVLIGPRHTLTAAHVVANTPLEALACVLNADGDASQRLPGARIHVHPEYRGSAAGQLMEHDVAVVELQQAAAPDVPTYPLLNAPLRVGQRIAFVGYGASGFGAEGVSVGAAPSVKRVGANRIDQFVFARDNPDRRIGFLFDFDGPELDSNRIGPSVASNGTLGNREESTFASGDSGSPSFVRDRSGRWIVVGINTFVGYGAAQAPSTFGTIGGGMLVSAYLDWIREVVPDAATVP